MAEVSEKRPLVSVVVPTYERSDLLLRALSSIEAQTYRPIEVILVDDGSGTPVSPPELSELPVTVVRHLRRLGPGAARNTGIAHARGDFVTFLDDDDEVTPDRVALAVADIGNHRMHACATSENHAPYQGDRRVDLLRDATPSVSQVLFRRPDLLQFDPTIRVGEDVEWWIRMADRAEFAWSEAVGVIIHRHETPRPGVAQLTHADCREQILRRHWKHLDKSARVRHLARVASLNLVAGRRTRAAWFAIRGFLLCPSRRAAATFIRSVLGKG